MFACAGGRELLKQKVNAYIRIAYTHTLTGQEQKHEAHRHVWYLKASFLVPPLTISVCVTPEFSFLWERTNLFSDEFAGLMNSGLLLIMQHHQKAVLSFSVLDIKLNKEMATNICAL